MIAAAACQPFVAALNLRLLFVLLFDQTAMDFSMPHELIDSGTDKRFVRRG